MITVKVAGDRVPGETTMSNIAGTGVAGVRLRLSAVSTDSTVWAAYPWATCTSDADGDCSFVVPVTTAATSAAGMNVDARPWVSQLSTTAGSGWNLMQLPLAIETGSFAYQFRLNTTVTAGSTYSSTTFTPFFKSSADPSGTNFAELPASHGQWTVVRDNPPLATRCGLDLAVVMDLSASIGAAMPAARAAVDTLIDNLVGTPSNVALFNFGTTSPRSGLVNYPQLMPVRTTAAAATVKALYSTWSPLGQTNWDQALSRVAQAAPSYDAVILLTDGLPTNHSLGAAGWGFVNIRSLEAGVFSANLVKSEDARIVSFFVSGTTPTTAQLNNIRAISGPTANSDYFVSSSYTQAAQQLAAFAKGNCRSSISVEKRIVDPGIAAAGLTKAQLDAVSDPAADWVFDAEATAPVTIGGPTSYTTGADGRVTVPLNFTDPFISGPLEVTERQQPDYALVQVGGSNASCVDANTGASVSLTNVGSPMSANPGFSTVAEANIPLDCVVYNQREPVTVEVDKTWVVDGVAYDVNDPDLPPGLSAALSLTGPGTATSSAQPWSTPRGGYAVGSTATISEIVELTGEFAACDHTAVVTEANGESVEVALGSGYDLELSEPVNTATLTNTVVCEQLLTLVKSVSHGEEPAGSWTLTASGPADAIDGPTGVGSVTGEVTALVPYALAESGGPDTYVAVGDWECALTADPDAAVEVDESSVTVPRGQDVTCTITNATATLTLLKHVIDPSPQFAADAWNLTASPSGLPGGTLPTRTVTGAEADIAGASTVEVRPGHEYTLSEDAAGSVLAYEQLRLERFDGTDWVPVDSPVVAAPAAGENAIYRFVNARIGAIALPQTGGSGSLPFLIVGGSLLFAVAAVGVWRARRRLFG